MIDKTEIGENIKALLKGYADEKSDISITVRTPEEADVYLDGEYFNTFSIPEKRFLRNIPKKTDNNEVFRINAVIARCGLAERYKEYAGAQVQLPAAENEIKDALQRARITDSAQKYSIAECLLYDMDISENINGAELDRLNYLAKVLSKLDGHEHALFRGCIEKKGISNLSVTDLINIAYNLQDCDVIYDLATDEQLGRFYADNGMIDWLADADERIWKYLDYASIGADMREAEDGIYTRDGYFVNNAKDFTVVYDGVTFPETFPDDEYMLRLLIRAKESAPESDDGKWLTLPVSKDGKTAFLRELGVGSFDDCVLLAVQSMEKNIPMCVTDLSQLGQLNSLAHRMRDMEKSGELAKYKAILASRGCKNIDEAVSYINSIGDYELYAEPSTIIEYAKDIFAREYAGVLPKSFSKHFNYASYAEELYSKGNLALTEYGVLKCLKTENEQMTMGDLP